MLVPIKEDKDGLVRCFKFKGVKTEKSITHIVEIVDDRKLWCTDWRKLNDILEGIYQFAPDDGEGTTFNNGWRLRSQKEAYRVCSLTTKLNSQLMWSFYASEHQGIAIELLLDPKRMNSYREQLLVGMSYDSRLPSINLQGNVEGDSCRQAARNILTHKMSPWKFEREIRLLNDSEYYQLNDNEKVVRVYYGVRMDPSVLQELRRRLGGNVEFVSIAKKYPKYFGRPYEFDERVGQ